MNSTSLILTNYLDQLKILPDKGNTLQAQWRMAKTSSKNHRDMMLNYEEVKKTLEGTEFEEYLN